MNNMLISEITIAVLLGLLIITTSIYLTYFSYQNYRRVKNYLNEGGSLEEVEIKKHRVLSILLIVYFAFSLFTFAIKTIYSVSPYINGNYYVSVNSTSMAAPLSSNTYLKEHQLTNQIHQYDVALFKGLKEETINQYDIILFKQDDKLIAHRVIEVKDSQTYKTQGDNNPAPDEWTVSKENVLGIYDHSLTFLSFINYLGYTPGFYVAIVGVTYDLGILLFFEIRTNKLLNSFKTTNVV